MKRRQLLAGLAAGLAAPMIARPAFAGGIALRVADSFPATHPYSINTKKWLDLVTEKTNGEVTFSYFPAEQLAKSADLLDAAQNGIADIVYAPPLYLSDRLPLSTVVALPLVGNVSDQQKLNDAFNTLAMTMLNDVEIEPLGVTTIRSLVTAPYQIMGRKDKFETLDQLGGKKLRSSGGVQERSVHALGAVPVAIPAPDLYPALQRGTVDGALFNLPTAAGYKLQEQLTWSTSNVNLGLFPVLYVMNERKRAELPEDILKVIEDSSRAVVSDVVQAEREQIDIVAKALEANGGGLFEVGPDQFAQWDQRLTSVRDDWTGSLSAQGKGAEAVLARWSELVTV